MSKLILHAGIHKTGTTAIQQFAFENRAQLLERGLLYPTFSPFPITLKDGHHPFGHAFSDLEGRPMTFDQAVILPKTWKVIAEEHAATTLVSVEAVYRHVVGSGPWQERRRAYLARIAEALADFETEVVIVFRRPDNYARSLYFESITTGHVPQPPFGEWLRSPRRFGLEYHENARLFREVFGKVTCHIYEDLVRPPGLVTNFFAALGYDVADIPEPGIIRKSLSPAQIVVKNHANARLSRKKDSREFVKWLQGPKAAELIETHLGGIEIDVWEDDRMRSDFLDSRAADIARLADDFFGGRRDLFAPLSPGGKRFSVPEVPPPLARAVERVLERFV